MENTSMKVVAGVLAMVALWWLVQVPSIINKILLFCTLGVNPYTGRNIPPARMAAMLGILLLLSIVFLFRKEISQGGRHISQRMKRSRRRTAPITAPLTAAVVPASVPVIAPPAPGYLHYDPVTQHALPMAALPVVAAKLQSRDISVPARRPQRSLKRHLSLFVSFGRLLKQLLMVPAHMVTSLFKRLGAGIVTTRKQIVLGADIAWIALCIFTQVAWRWLRPRIEQFDGWLEHKLNENPSTGNILAVGRELEATLLAWWRQALLFKDEYLATFLRAMRK
jgi:hypothetical protein